MDILDDPLIKKYFWPEWCAHPIHVTAIDGPLRNPLKVCERCCADAALNVLRAMQEPIKPGERYLCIGASGSVSSPQTFQGADSMDYLHFYSLRLPDAFQKKPDPVEEKIGELAEMVHSGKTPSCGWWKDALRELVALVRKERP